MRFWTSQNDISLLIYLFFLSCKIPAFAGMTKVKPKYIPPPILVSKINCISGIKPWMAGTIKNDKTANIRILLIAILKKEKYEKNVPNF